MKYIGPFLRISSLNKNNINSELFHLSKESLKHIVLNSKCGIVIPLENLKSKAFSNNDINTIKEFSPLLCVYKKGDSKLINDYGKLSWNEEKFKKQVEICPNAFMTLSLLELTDYYAQFKDIDENKYLYYKLYMSICKNQLTFYASYLRNIEGVFVDKIDSTDVFSENLVLEDKNSKFKFSNQAVLMAAYYKYSCCSSDKHGEDFRKFSTDILNMFLNFKDEIYELPLSELNKVCFGLNIFYNYSKDEKARLLLLDLCELLVNKYEIITSEDEMKNPIEQKCLMFINLVLTNKFSNVLKFKELYKKTYYDLIKIYDENLGIFSSSAEEKKINFSSVEIILYLLCMLLYSELNETEEYNSMICNVFKYQVVNSGLILSWPEAPNLDDVERYKNFSLNSEDLLDEQNFIMPNISTPENTEFASVFIKSICFNRKKECFKQDKTSFYSEPNMIIFFLIIYFRNILQKAPQ